MSETRRAAVRRDESGRWEEIYHRRWTEDDLIATDWLPAWVRNALRDHQFQEEPAPGLYPDSPTVCSCGATPGLRPDDDYEWWIDHLLTSVE